MTKDAFLEALIKSPKIRAKCPELLRQVSPQRLIEFIRPLGWEFDSHSPRPNIDLYRYTRQNCDDGTPFCCTLVTTDDFIDYDDCVYMWVERIADFEEKTELQVLMELLGVV